MVAAFASAGAVVAPATNLKYEGNYSALQQRIARYADKTAGGGTNNIYPTILNTNSLVAEGHPYYTVLNTNYMVWYDFAQLNYQHY